MRAVTCRACRDSTPTSASSAETRARDLCSSASSLASSPVRPRAGVSILADLPEPPLRIDDALTRDGQIPLPAHQVLLDAVQHHGGVPARFLGLQASHPRGLALGLRGPQLDERRPPRLLLAREQSPNPGQPILESREIHRHHRHLDGKAPLPQIVVALRLPLLARQRTDLGRHLRDHILQPLQVQFGPGQPPSRDPGSGPCTCRCPRPPRTARVAPPRVPRGSRRSSGSR